MKRFVQGFFGGVVVILLVGAIATAAAGSRADPSDSTAPTIVPSPSNDEPSESEAHETEKPQAKNEDRGVERASGSPNFSACDHLAGLDNAICRHTELLKLQPKNTGLANAMAHLRTNAEKHAAGTGSHGAAESHAGS